MSERYTARDVARILKLPEDRLRPCLRAALFPTTRSLTFSFQDLLLLKTAKGLLDAQVPVARIRRLLRSLKRQLPPEQPLVGLRIYADGQRIVVWDASGRWHPDSGQFLFDFEPQRVAQEVRALAPSEPPPGEHQRTAEDWFQVALELEHDSPREAAEAYRQALHLQPTLVAARINLGCLLQRSQQPEEAEVCFRMAQQQCPDDPALPYYLGTVLEQRGDAEGALHAYRQAVELDPSWQEAHRRLGSLYEHRGLKTEAIRHFAEARRLTRPPARPRPRRHEPPA